MINSPGLRSSTIGAVLVLAACLVVSGSGAAEPKGAEPSQTSADSKPRPPEKTTAWIRSTPNPVPVESDQRTTTVSWDTCDQSMAQVYLLVEGKPEQLFAAGTRGSQDVAWIRTGS